MPGGVYRPRCLVASGWRGGCLPSRKNRALSVYLRAGDVQREGNRIIGALRQREGLRIVEARALDDDRDLVECQQAKVARGISQ